MKTLKLLGLAVGLAALAACAKNDDNVMNADLNATTTDNLAVDNMATNVDMNAGMNATNLTNDTNLTGNNASDNSVNSY